MISKILRYVPPSVEPLGPIASPFLNPDSQFSKQIDTAEQGLLTKYE